MRKTATAVIVLALNTFAAAQATTAPAGLVDRLNADTQKTTDRLHDTLVPIKVKPVPLAAAMGRLCDKFNVNIYLDRPALAALNITSAHTATIDGATSIEDAIEQAFKPLTPAGKATKVLAVGPVIVVSTPDGAEALAKQIAADAAAVDAAGGKLKDAFGRPLPAIRFDDVALRIVLAFTTEVSQAPIDVDSDSLQAAGVSDHPVSIRAQDTPVYEVLRLITHDGGAGTPIDLVLDPGADKLVIRAKPKAP